MKKLILTVSSALLLLQRGGLLEFSTLPFADIICKRGESIALYTNSRKEGTEGRKEEKKGSQINDLNFYLIKQEKSKPKVSNLKEIRRSKN